MDKKPGKEEAWWSGYPERMGKIRELDFGAISWALEGMGRSGTGLKGIEGGMIGSCNLRGQIQMAEGSRVATFRGYLDGIYKTNFGGNTFPTP